MSLDVFKQNMLSYMRNQVGIDSYEAFAEKLTTEYDLAVKRGYQIVNQVSVKTGNTELMKNLTTLALLGSLQKRQGLHEIVNELGRGVVGYWTGAELNLFPVPIIPAMGTIQNIATTSAAVINPGTFPDFGLQSPISSTEPFLDTLISAIQIHLSTIEGIYNTTSIYPTAPPTVAPGFLQWKGYSIPPTRRSVASPEEIQETIEQTTDDLSAEDIAAKQKELATATQELNDTKTSAEGKQTIREYTNLLKSEISSGKQNATPVNITAAEVGSLVEETPPQNVCGDGMRVVEIAKKDLGIVEFGSPPGLNYGGFVNGSRIQKPGRIDEMISICGLDNQEKVRRTGSGYYWCAAAVAMWWQEAGLPIPPGAASCDSWMSWGKKNGWFSTKPKIGAAILYGSPSDAHHIGIVASVSPTGLITTIEGNTSGGGFNRNGVGVFVKSPKRYIGFISPPECI